MSDVVLAADRDGAGPRLVLVHGFTLTRDCWGPLPADLAADHEVVRVDAPGHGGSSAVRADLTETAGLLAAFGPATYVGYSMGGRMCLEMALRHPEAVTGLVLISATAGIDSDEDRPRRRAADEKLADWIEADGVDAFIDHWLGLPLFTGLPAEARYETERRANTAAGLASSLRLAGAGTQAPAWDRLHTLTMPVLVVVGENDAKFSALGHRLVEGIGANASVAVIPEVGHTTHLEAPDAFEAVFEPWLRAHAV
jgi:2-succinyl-6-hydroxy-2,4-cyclohexadiene-1-carboxylate synthase